MVRRRDPASEGERLFARYLTEVRGLERDRDWDFEPLWDFTAKTPDFFVRADGEEVLLDVKEFARREARDGPADARDAIRRKIHEGKEQMKPFRDRIPCGLVLRSGGCPQTDTQRPETVLAAMLGYERLAWSLEVVHESQVSFRLAFLQDGDLVQVAAGVPRNTTLGALLDVRMRSPRLEAFAAGHRLCRAYSTVPEVQEMFASRLGDVLEAEGIPADLVPCVTVHENPFARRPFPSHVFCGPFDSCWGLRDDAIAETFAGIDLAAVRDTGRRCALRLVGA